MGSKMPCSGAAKAPNETEVAEPTSVDAEIRPNLSLQIRLVRPCWLGGPAETTLTGLGAYTTVAQLSKRILAEHGGLWGPDRLALFLPGRTLGKDELIKDILAPSTEPYELLAVAWAPASEWLSVVQADDPGKVAVSEDQLSSLESMRSRVMHASPDYRNYSSASDAKQCSVCLDRCYLSGAAGQSCEYSHDHYACYQCISGLVRSSSHTVKITTDLSGPHYTVRLRCPNHPSCSGWMTVRDPMSVDPSAVRNFLDALRKCASCGSEDGVITAEEADNTRCSGNHALCSTCVASRVTRDLDAHDVAYDGSLTCGCALPDGTPCHDRLPLEAYSDRLSTTVRSRLMSQLLSQRQALVDGYEQMLGWDVAAVRRFAIEHIINLRCPACRKTFQDHTDCPSVTCSNCSAGFCARCLRFNRSCAGYDREHEHERWHRGRRMRRLVAYIGSYDVTEDDLEALFDDSFRAVLRRIDIDPDLLLVYIHLLRTPTSDNLLHVAATHKAKLDTAQALTTAPAAPTTGAAPIPIPTMPGQQQLRMGRRQLRPTHPPREAAQVPRPRSVSPPSRRSSPGGVVSLLLRRAVEEESAAAPSSPPLTPRTAGGPPHSAASLDSVQPAAPVVSTSGPGGIRPDDSWIVVGRRGNRPASSSGGAGRQQQASSGSGGGHRRLSEAGRGSSATTREAHRPGSSSSSSTRGGRLGGRASSGGRGGQQQRQRVEAPRPRAALLAEIVEVARREQNW